MKSKSECHASRMRTLSRQGRGPDRTWEVRGGEARGQEWALVRRCDGTRVTGQCCQHWRGHPCWRSHVSALLKQLVIWPDGTNLKESFDLKVKAPPWEPERELCTRRTGNTNCLAAAAIVSELLGEHRGSGEDLLCAVANTVRQGIRDLLFPAHLSLLLDRPQIPRSWHSLACSPA